MSFKLFPDNTTLLELGPLVLRYYALAYIGGLVIGWRWLEQAIRAEEGLAKGNAGDVDFYQGKLQAARYFLTWEVPSCHHDLSILEARDDTCLNMQDAWF